MIVMTTTSQTRPTTARGAPSAAELESQSFDEIADDIGRIAERIRAGQAFLKVVAYPWGVEFEVCEEGGR
jgi:hypothetical protein